MLKRAIDFSVCATSLLILSPILVAIAMVVVVDNGFPIFYCQQRVGRGFVNFRIVKFRSMKMGTDGSKITVAGDSRITRVGRMLRALKLDELPQLWNVVRGDMSLVGPRPEIVEYVEMFRERYQTILSVRPGITDLASVQFRNEENILARSPDPLREYLEHILPAKLDLAEDYVKHLSILTDFRIMYRTVAILLMRP